MLGELFQEVTGLFDRPKREGPVIIVMNAPALTAK